MLKYISQLHQEDSLRLIRFLIVGGFGAVTYILGAYVASRFITEAWIASLIVYFGLIPIVYLIQRRFVFESNQPYLGSFLRYLTIQGIGLLISTASPFFLSKLNIPPLSSFVFAAILIGFISYVLQLCWAFKEK